MMRRRSGFSWVGPVLVVWTLLFLWVFGPGDLQGRGKPQAPQAEAVAPRLLEDFPRTAWAPGTQRVVERQAPEIVRRRWVRIRGEVLERAAETGGFILNLFPDVEYVVEGFRAVSVVGGRAWTGRLRGFPWGGVIFSEVGGVYWGSVIAERWHYEIRPASVEQGIYGVYEIDPKALPRDQVLEPEVPAGGMQAPESSVVSSGQATVYQDVLVVYTPAARDGAGGQWAIEAAIVNMVVTANQAYSNSRIPLQLRLVGMREVAYTESGSCNTDFEHLRFPNDGYMDEVHVWRQNDRADMVILIVAQCDCGGRAGLSCLWGRCDPDWGFAVIAYLNGMVFTHELGHNQGCMHDWYVVDIAGMYTYSHGHVDLVGRFYDIMAYSNKCDASGVSCSWIPYLSNPNVLYHGRPTGVPVGTNTSCVRGNLSNPDCDADCALTLTQTARWVARYMVRGSSIGVYDSSNGKWYLDKNGNGIWDGCGTDSCGTFGGSGYVPVTGDWNGDGWTDTGVVYDWGWGLGWYLDANGNGVWDGCSVDRCFFFGGAGSKPVAGDWNGDGKTDAGVVYDWGWGLGWYLDANGNGVWDGCGVDWCFFFGSSGHIPVSGDWNEDGTDNFGVYDPSWSAWYLDGNGNGVWDGCGVDWCLFFGSPGYRPVVARQGLAVLGRILLNETFDGGIPATWTVIDGGVCSGLPVWTWNAVNPCNRSIGSPFAAPWAMVDPNCAGYPCWMDEQLITPSVDASGCTRVLLGFSNQYRGGGVARVYVSADGGATWTQVLWMNFYDDGYPTPNTKMIDITAIAAGRSNVKIRFDFVGGGNGWWAIDNVKVVCF